MASLTVKYPFFMPALYASSYGVPEKLLLVSFRAGGPPSGELDIWWVAHDPLLVAWSAIPSMLRCEVMPTKKKHEEKQSTKCHSLHAKIVAKLMNKQEGAASVHEVVTQYLSNQTFIKGSKMIDMEGYLILVHCKLQECFHSL